MRKQDNPCFGCTAETGRHPGCHDKCQRHKDAVFLLHREQDYLKRNLSACANAEHRIMNDAKVWNDKVKNRNTGRGKH